jgi:divalent metal cation (Fe/Co/Zn/Cd) transporter
VYVRYLFQVRNADGRENDATVGERPKKPVNCRAAPDAPAAVESYAVPVTVVVETTGRLASERRARLLAWIGNGWHLVEFAIALGAGLAAGSIALVGFGFDSLIEALSGGVIVWLFTGGRGASAAAERRAQQLVAGGYFVLAAYVAVESVRDLVGGHHPEASWIGIGLAAFTAPTMPLLARAKRRVGQELGSSAVVSEAGQNQLCAYLSIALLLGLLANAVAGWWWADPGAALVIGALAVREGRESWRGESCDCC